MDACAVGTGAPTLVLGLKAWAGEWEDRGTGEGGVVGGIDSCPMQRSPVTFHTMVDNVFYH